MSSAIVVDVRFVFHFVIFYKKKNQLILKMTCLQNLRQTLDDLTRNGFSVVRIDDFVLLCSFVQLNVPRATVPQSSGFLFLLWIPDHDTAVLLFFLKSSHNSSSPLTGRGGGWII